MIIFNRECPQHEQKSFEVDGIIYCRDCSWSPWVRPMMEFVDQNDGMIEDGAIMRCSTDINEDIWIKLGAIVYDDTDSYLKRYYEKKMKEYYEESR